MTKINQAVEILRAGGLVAFPTETVYGLGADATNQTAVLKIYAAKERPSNHPLIVHIGSVEQLTQWAEPINSQAWRLANTFWPGPLTLVLPKKPCVHTVLTGGQETIALRIPQHPLAQALLKAFKGGIAAPSANKFTHISPTTARAVHEELGASVDLILDGGACTLGLESTIVNLSGHEPQILRPGAITIKDIEQVLGVKVESCNANKIRAPGMHALHYAPRTKTTLISTQNLQKLFSQLSSEDLPAVVLTYSGLSATGDEIHCIKMPADAAAYAHQLYQTLRSADNQGYQHILIEAVPQGIQWEAIRDRLSKASMNLSYLCKGSETR